MTNFVFGLVSLGCQLRLLEYFFWVIFKKRNGFFFLLTVSHTCSMPRQDVFSTFSLAQSHKILSKFSKLSVILKHRGKNFVMMTSIVRLFSNRS